MKKSFLLATMVAIFATGAIAQTAPVSPKKLAKIEKKEDRITEHKAAHEVKKEHKTTHRQAMKQAKKDLKQSK